MCRHMHIVLYAEVDAQCDKLAKVVSVTSSIASSDNSVRPTTNFQRDLGLLLFLGVHKLHYIPVYDRLQEASIIKCQLNLFIRFDRTLDL